MEQGPSASMLLSMETHFSFGEIRKKTTTDNWSDGIRSNTMCTPAGSVICFSYFKRDIQLGYRLEWIHFWYEKSGYRYLVLVAAEYELIESLK